MTDATHAELDRICTEICSKCYWPFKCTSQVECDTVCAACRIPIDLANLAEKLEAAAPPKEGETVYVIVNDYDNCPLGVDAYEQCRDCKRLDVFPEHFSAAETLDLWYKGETYRREADACVALKKLLEAAPS